MYNDRTVDSASVNDFNKLTARYLRIINVRACPERAQLRLNKHRVPLISRSPRERNELEFVRRLIRDARELIIDEPRYSRARAEYPARLYIFSFQRLYAEVAYAVRENA